MSYKGIVKNGVVVLEPSAKLMDGTIVRIELEETPARSESHRTIPREQLDAVWRMGELAVPTGIRDLATNADHYLYGHPKVTDGK